jgi:hypothetical protein
VLGLIILVNYLIGVAAARTMMYMAINILPHILGVLLFSYWYIAFIIILYVLYRKYGKSKKEAETVLLPGTIINPIPGGAGH